ncbi:MAG: hypothetical protein MJZ43_01625 [Bacteroidaceae bacterium]|nr:hypothetical protein [Bacteroidaceae bacterium]
MISNIRPHLIALCLICVAAAASAQTVIDLHRGGAAVRSKSMDDYAVSGRTADALRQDSLDYADCLARAYSHLHADSLAQARQCFLRALQLRPEAPGNYILHRELGKIHLAEGKIHESIGEFDHVLRQFPTDKEARRHRAVCHLALQHPQAALDDCLALSQQALDTASTVEVLFLQAEAHRQLRHFPQVDADLSRILALAPLNANARLLQILNLEALGQPQEARNRLNLYLEGHPADVEALAARADFLLRHGYPLLAREDADLAIKLRPDVPSLYLLRAKISDEMGEKALSSRDRRTALKLQNSQ